MPSFEIVCSGLISTLQDTGLLNLIFLFLYLSLREKKIIQAVTGHVFNEECVQVEIKRVWCECIRLCRL